MSFLFKEKEAAPYYCPSHCWFVVVLFCFFLSSFPIYISRRMNELVDLVFFCTWFRWISRLRLHDRLAQHLCSFPGWEKFNWSSLPGIDLSVQSSVRHIRLFVYIFRFCPSVKSWKIFHLCLYSLLSLLCCLRRINS